MELASKIWKLESSSRRIGKVRNSGSDIVNKYWYEIHRYGKCISERDKRPEVKSCCNKLTALVKVSQRFEITALDLTC